MKRTSLYAACVILISIFALQHNISAQALPESTEHYIRNTLLEIGYNAHDVNLLIIHEGGAIPAAMDYTNGILYISSNLLTTLQAEKHGHESVKAILAHEMGHYYQLSYTLLCNYYTSQNLEPCLYALNIYTIMHKIYNVALHLSAVSLALRFYNRSTAHAYEFDADRRAAEQLGSSEPMIRALLALREYIKKGASQHGFGFKRACEEQIKMQQNQMSIRLNQSSEERAKAQEAAQEKLQRLSDRVKPIGEWIDHASKNTAVQTIARACYAPFSWTRKLLKPHPTFRDRINKLIAYHEEHFDTPLPDDIYEEVANMGTPAYPGARVVQKASRSLDTAFFVSLRTVLPMFNVTLLENALKGYRASTHL